MFLRTILLLALPCAVLCLTRETQQTTIKPGTPESPVGEVGILLSSAVCTSGIVLVVLIPTIIFYKYFDKGMKDEMYEEM